MKQTLKHPAVRRPGLEAPGWESTRGTKNRNSRLTELQAWMILTSNEPTSKLAKRFGIKATTVRQIRQRRRWRHLRPDIMPTEEPLNA